MKPELGYVILAAGKGTRMHSDSPKVLHQALGKPLLAYVYDALTHVPASHVWTVIGFQAQKVQDCFAGQQGQFVLQDEQLGTGHAVMLAWPHVAASGISHVCVLNGDTPHVPTDAISDLVDLCAAQNAGMGMLTLRLENPFGYGRIIRNAQSCVERVVEEKDFIAADHGGEVHEVNSGVYVFDVGRCAPLLEMMDRDNAQQEYYLTQMIALCAAEGGSASSPWAGYGRSPSVRRAWIETGSQRIFLTYRFERFTIFYATGFAGGHRSEERRVGKECRSRWSPI